jgi:hypothetical protein
MCVFIALATMAVLTWFFAEAWRFAVGVGTVWLLVLLAVTSVVMVASHGYCFYLIFSSRMQVISTIYFTIDLIFHVHCCSTLEFVWHWLLAKSCNHSIW